MTEIEKIIKKGIIKPEFLNDEIIDGCEVKADLKKVWAVSLDLLYEFDIVCKKLGLKYYLWAGNLIGYARHNGFVPWDDDIDIIMFRDDYDKLMELGPTMFKSPYFLQNPYTDPGYLFSYAKLRNSNTSVISLPFRYEDFNQGGAIDIFPLDNYIQEGVYERYEMINNLIIENSTYMRSRNPYLGEKDKIRVANYRCSENSPLEVYEKMEKIATQFSKIETENVICALCTLSLPEKVTYKRDWFSEPTIIDYYGLEVPIPKYYDDVLKKTYGDYMKLPPIEKRATHHTTAYFDLDVDYKTTLKYLREMDQIKNE